MDRFTILKFPYETRARARDMAIDCHVQELANRQPPLDADFPVHLIREDSPPVTIATIELGSCPSCYRTRESVDTLGHADDCYFGPNGIG